MGIERCIQTMDELLRFRKAYIQVIKLSQNVLYTQIPVACYVHAILYEGNGKLTCFAQLPKHLFWPLKTKLLLSTENSVLGM